MLIQADASSLVNPLRAFVAARATLREADAGGRIRGMKSLLQTWINRREHRLPIPEPVIPGADGMAWMERAILALDAALGTTERAETTYARWRERQGRRDFVSGSRFASVRSAAMAEAGSSILENRNAPPPRPSTPEEIESVLDAFFTENPATRASIRAFSDYMRRLVAERFDGDAPRFYRAAGISRFQYSKLLSHPEECHPSKETVLKMALAAQLPLFGARHMLELAGYAFSEASPSDRVWAACFEHGLYYLPAVERLLAKHG